MSTNKNTENESELYLAMKQEEKDNLDFVIVKRFWVGSKEMIITYNHNSGSYALMTNKRHYELSPDEAVGLRYAVKPYEDPNFRSFADSTDWDRIYLNIPTIDFIWINKLDYIQGSFINAVVHKDTFEALKFLDMIRLTKDYRALSFKAYFFADQNDIDDYWKEVLDKFDTVMKRDTWHDENLMNITLDEIEKIIIDNHPLQLVQEENS